MKGFSWRFGVVVLLLAATLSASKLSERRKPEELRRPLESMPNRIGEWSGRDQRPLEGEVLALLKPTSYLSRLYRRDDRLADVFVAYYSQQRAGESMHSPKNCLPGNGWEVLQSGRVDVPLGDRVVSVNKYSVQNGSERLLVLYWYQSKTRIIASEYWGKACLVRDALAGGHTAGSLVRVTLPDGPGALENAIDLASRLIPQMQECFGR